MIAVDTSSLVALLVGQGGQDVERLARAMASEELVLPPIVLTEILTDQASADAIRHFLSDLTTLEILPNYWERAGLSRRRLRALGLKAKVGDALIAQSCIDHDVALITRDADFRHFAKHCGLKLA